MNRKILYAIPLLSMILLLGLSLQMQNGQYSYIVFADGVPDAYSNQIGAIAAGQWNGTCYCFFANYWTNNASDVGEVGASGNGTAAITQNVYTVTTDEFNWRVHDNAGNTSGIVFVCTFLVNDTLASSGAEALSFTEGFINITGAGYGGITNGAFVQGHINFDPSDGTIGVGHTGSYYDVVMQYVWWVDDYPAAGVTYTVSINFYCYY